MKKVIYLMIMLMVSFGFFGVVNADEETEGITDISDASAITDETGETEDISDTESTEEPVEETYEEEPAEENMENPDTGLNDYVMYIIPVLIIGGSFLIFKRNSFN